MTRDPLLAAGVCLVIVGVFLRGFARGNRRTQALRKQHRLDDPSADNEPRGAELHLEKYLPRYAAGSIITGLVLIIAAFFR